MNDKPAVRSVCIESVPFQNPRRRANRRKKEKTFTIGTRLLENEHAIFAEACRRLDLDTSELMREALRFAYEGGAFGGETGAGDKNG